MRRYRENPEITRLLLEEERPLADSLEAWQQALSKFEAFEYFSARQALADFELVVSRGLWILQYKDPKKCVELAQWALTNEQFACGAHSFSEFCYLKALSLIKLGKHQEALDGVLEEMQATSDMKVCRKLFSYGVHLFIELKPFQRQGELDGRDDITPAPEFIISFVRELMQLNFLNPKLPPELYQSEENRAPISWGRLHKILLVRSPAEKRKVLRQRFDRYRGYGVRTYPSLLHVSCSKRISPSETSAQTWAWRKKSRR